MSKINRTILSGIITLAIIVLFPAFRIHPFGDSPEISKFDGFHFITYKAEDGVSAINFKWLFVEIVLCVGLYTGAITRLRKKSDSEKSSSVDEPLDLN